MAISKNKSISTDNGGNKFLLRFIDSDTFTLYHCIYYLERYAKNIGIHFHLCQKVRSYPYHEIEFFIPQLVQLLVTVNTKSMALEDLLLDLCMENTHYCLMTFWQLQANLSEMFDDSESFGFQVSRRMFNKLQYLLFNVGEPPSMKFRENPIPALILASAMAGVVGLPGIMDLAGPIAFSQGRKEKSRIFHILPKLSRSKSNLESSSSATVPNTISVSTPTTPIRSRNGSFSSLSSSHSTRVASNPSSLKPVVDNISSLSIASNSPVEKNLLDHNRFSTKHETLSLPDLRRKSSIISNTFEDNDESQSSDDNDDNENPDEISYQSNYNNHINGSSALVFKNKSFQNDINRNSKIKILKTNYFNCETQFVTALQTISTRLLSVPKKARLSSLRVELAMLNQDLPAEVDIPVLLAADNGNRRLGQRKEVHHKILRISPAEATVLNSAERVPYLLLIEFLRDGFDFDPNSKANRKLIKENKDTRYIFDSSTSKNSNLFSELASKGKRGRKSSNTRASYSGSDTDTDEDCVNDSENLVVNKIIHGDNKAQEVNVLYNTEGTDMGDISMRALYKKESGNSEISASNDASNLSGAPIPTNSRNSPGPDITFGSASTYSKSQFPSSTDVSGIATQMRTAAIMLTQLESTASTRLSKSEISSIRDRIIANMQAMEEMTVLADFDVVVGGAGERKLENDLKTGGMVLDDPSATNLGEDWDHKKERIRRSSPYGKIKGWDLCSVIFKTGDDLRQESFACQLIQAFHKIWEDAQVPVWVKRMRILITSETAGLVETITNGISIHSIKKALTNASIAAGTNPKGTIATLKDHFRKTFGDSDSEKYKNALESFVRSLAAASIICYLLQIKDRHNGNILLDNMGRVIHIDFGFLLSNSPGNVGFEAAPFKLTNEYVDLMGGIDSEYFKLFKDLMKQAFKVVRKNSESILILVEMMQRDSALPCFSLGPATVEQLKQRFHLGVSDSEVDNFVETYLIHGSIGSRYTWFYDEFQRQTQGILP
ncbi:hypothetical protein NADFUDRAFT_83264 [Nadsonia fulvescens var. elongata DSM 6958]|uniref:1-phosphatidylinositol 4-kinase n=1 Tax=Nadsonia fulvescens var. elongata DSM 6958 TaxID=857566 RepID=A0A1E3PIH6_9ASCO|nr:hypothetical protein NADFUDRAFT_83264 [Nadsonia fulvescens var. elongata DSM 6958]